MAAESATDTSEALASSIVCENCSSELPLLSSNQLQQSLWICVGCGASHLAYPDVDLLAEFSSRVRIHEQQFDSGDSPGIPAHIRVHLASIANRAVPQGTMNRRRSARVVNPLMVSAIELDNNFVVMGAALQIIMTDVSREGVGLALPDGTEAPCLALQFPAREEQVIQVIARVVRQQALIPPYVAVGCEFMFRLGS